MCARQHIALRILFVERDSDNDPVVSAWNQKVVETHIRVVAEGIPEQVQHPMSDWFIVVVSKLKTHGSGREGVEFGHYFDINKVIGWTESSAHVMRAQKTNLSA